MQRVPLGAHLAGLDNIDRAVYFARDDVMAF